MSAALSSPTLTYLRPCQVGDLMHTDRLIRTYAHVKVCRVSNDLDAEGRTAVCIHVRIRGGDASDP